MLCLACGGTLVSLLDRYQYYISLEVSFYGGTGHGDGTPEGRASPQVCPQLLDTPTPPPSDSCLPPGTPWQPWAGQETCATYAFVGLGAGRRRQALSGSPWRL